MCGIAGAWLPRAATMDDVAEARRMIARQQHRGPDSSAAVASGQMVLASARLAIVDAEGGGQPFSDASGAVQVVFNGEIYNHHALRAALTRRGYRLRSVCDGEVIAHLYREHGADCFNALEGQFAIALADPMRGVLYLARDPMGICPLHWAWHRGALYFSSEIKGLFEVAGMPRQAEPRALLQLAHFGTVCAPLTPFAGVRQLPAAHMLCCRQGRTIERRYWSLTFPLAGEHAALTERQAADGVAERLQRAVASHAQGQFAATGFLSGGIDSALIAALLQADGAGPLAAFCATSEHRHLDEGDAARHTASRLGVALTPIEVDEAAIAQTFPRLIWHGETPVISTEAAALLRLAEAASGRSKIVLTGEGADEAFGGYLAFRQYRRFGALTAPGLAPLRTLARPLFAGHYGSACLLPDETRLDAWRAHFGCVPAQAYEWALYDEVLTPLLAPPLRALAAAGGHWDGFVFDAEAVRGRHWLDRSLAVAYQVMLPNYLLGTHGDRIFAANSVEGRYPFLARELVEFAAALPPAFKLRHGREKHVLRLAAERWLPPEIAWRRKTRFVMPFGTPFVGAHAAPLYAELLSPQRLAEYGYFDPARVAALLAALAAPPQTGGKARRYLQRLALGLGATFVVSTQLWHYLYLAGGDADHPQTPPRRAGRPALV